MHDFGSSRRCNQNFIILDSTHLWGVFHIHFVPPHLMPFCLSLGMLCRTVNEISRLGLFPISWNWHCRMPPKPRHRRYKRTEANKASNKKLHLDIGNLLKSIYLLQANIERLAFSTNFFLEVAKLPFELKTVPRYVIFGGIDDLSSI